MKRAAVSTFGAQAQTASNLLNAVKIIASLAVAVLLWAARLQWTVADLQRQVTEIVASVADIRRDRSERIKDADAWRTQCDIANAKRDLLLEQLVKANELAKVNGAERPAARR